MHIFIQIHYKKSLFHIPYWHSDDDCEMKSHICIKKYNIQPMKQRLRFQEKVLTAYCAQGEFVDSVW